MGISSLVWLCGTSRASPAKLLGPAVEPAGLLGLIAGSSQAPAAPPLCDSWGPAACTYLGECLRGSELFGKHQGAQGQGVPTRLHKPPKEVEHGLLLLLCCLCSCCRCTEPAWALAPHASLHTRGLARPLVAAWLVHGLHLGYTHVAPR